MWELDMVSKSTFTICVSKKKEKYLHIVPKLREITTN